MALGDQSRCDDIVPSQGYNVTNEGDQKTPEEASLADLWQQISGLKAEIEVLKTGLPIGLVGSNRISPARSTEALRA